MADVDYTIDVQAEGIGTDATAEEVTALANSLEAAEKVVTRFDGALDAAGARLAEAGAAADAANSALAEAEAQYARLERAATRAGKKVERAAAKGKDTTQLQAAADAAAAAVREQAQVVDQASAKARKAAAAQKELAKAYKTVGKAADRAAEETRGTDKSFGDLFGAAGALGGPLGGVAGQISGIGDGLRAGGGKGGLILGAFAAGNAFIMMMKASIGLAVGLASAVGGLLAFAVAADKATSKKLQSAWEKAGKSIKKLFEGVHTEKLVKPIEGILGMLDEGTSASKGLSKIFETLLNPIIDGLVEGEAGVKEFFSGLIIGALDAIIYVLRLRNSIAKAIPKETREKIKEVVESLLGLKDPAKEAESAFLLLAVAIGILLIPVVLLAANVLFFWTAWKGFLNNLDATKAKLKEVAAAIGGFIGNTAATLGKLGEAGAAAGKNLTDGLAKGIKNGTSDVVSAASALAGAAAKGIANALESKSPSRLAERIMFTVPQGATRALERGVAPVERAGRRLGQAATDGLGEPLQRRRGEPARMSSRGRQGQRGAGSGSITLNFREGSIVINAPSGDAKGIAQEVRRVLLAEIDGAALQLGGGELVTGTT